MKAKTITMQIVKTTSVQYETVRLQAEYTLLESDTLQNAFIEAKIDLEEAFSTMYPKVELKPVDTKEILYTTTAGFSRICNALHTKLTTLEEIEQKYTLSKDALDYFDKNNWL